MPNVIITTRIVPVKKSPLLIFFLFRRAFRFHSFFHAFFLKYAIRFLDYSKKNGV